MQRVAELLKGAGVVKRGRFKLSSGKVSSVYVDLRILPSRPLAFREVIEEMAKVVEGWGFDAICGIAVGGLPMAACLAYRLLKPLIYLRRNRKDHGTGRIVEGDVEADASVLVVDDVATTGSTLAWAVGILRKQGYRVDRALVVVDREEGAREKLREVGVELVSLTTLREILGGEIRAQG